MSRGAVAAAFTLSGLVGEDGDTGGGRCDSGGRGAPVISAACQLWRKMTCGIVSCLL